MPRWSMGCGSAPTWPGRCTDLPIDDLRLEPLFPTDLGDMRSAAIVRSTVGLAHSLDHRPVAEGVEDEPAIQALRDCG